MTRPLTASLVCLFLVACATTPASRDAVAPSSAKAERAFVESSLVLVPESVGDFALDSATDYPGHPEWGVGIRYANPDFPDVRVDLYVYPIGRVERAHALKTGMRQLRDELAAMTANGRYVDLEYGSEIDFNLDGVGEDGVAGVVAPRPAPAQPQSEEEEVLAAIAAVEASLDPAMGRKLSLRFTRDGNTFDSRAYMFYRGLYLYKGRVSTTSPAMPADSFDRFANHAMSRLVPAVQVRSTGKCFETTITVDPDAGESEMQVQLMRGAAESLTRTGNEDCREQLDPTAPAGHRGILIEYPASMWN